MITSLVERKEFPEPIRSSTKDFEHCLEYFGLLMEEVESRELGESEAYVRSRQSWKDQGLIIWSFAWPSASFPVFISPPLSKHILWRSFGFLSLQVGLATLRYLKFHHQLFRLSQASPPFLHSSRILYREYDSRQSQSGEKRSAERGAGRSRHHQR